MFYRTVHGPTGHNCVKERERESGVFVHVCCVCVFACFVHMCLAHMYSCVHIGVLICGLICMHHIHTCVFLHASFFVCMYMHVHMHMYI